MRGIRLRALLAAMVCAVAAAVPPAPAQGAASDPLFVLTPPSLSNVPPPAGSLEGPCGLVVDVSGSFYVSDYYHHAIDVFSSTPGYKLQLPGVDPLDGPCGLALDSTGRLYVNNFHRNVVRYTPSSYPPTANTAYGAGVVFDSSHPTGVAVDPATNNVYVDDRTYVALYDSAGTQLGKVGLGGLGDAYGLGFANGRLYVPDAAGQTVKIYEPSTSITTPVDVIAGPPGGFHSLTDSAIAVDRVTGDVYVAEAVGSPFTEHPETTIDVFDSAGNYRGHLKFNVVNGSPVGLAVDNSFGINQGRVYVTSGNTAKASVYAYGPGAATTVPSQPAAFSLAVSTSGTGAGSVTSEVGGAGCSDTCTVEALAGQELTLAASPDPGSVFAGWSGAGCSGSGPCAITMDEADTVDAAFEVLPPSSLAAPMAPVAGALATAGVTVASRPRAKKRGVTRHHHRAKRRHSHHRRRTH